MVHDSGERVKRLHTMIHEELAILKCCVEVSDVKSDDTVTVKFKSSTGIPAQTLDWAFSVSLKERGIEHTYSEQDYKFRIPIRQL